MIFRSATVDDFEAVMPLIYELAKLHVEGKPEIFKAVPKLSKKDFKKLIKSDNRTFTLLEIDGEIVGVSNWQIRQCRNNETLSDRTFAVIDELAISEKHRRKGYGKLLFNKTLELAAQKGATSVELYVWEFNESAKKFYESLNMKPQRILLESEI